jgi:hypothetical protein
MHAYTILLGFSPSGIKAMKDLGSFLFLFVTRVFEKFRPAMLAEQAVIVGVFLIDLEKDHTARLLCDLAKSNKI